MQPAEPNKGKRLEEDVEDLERDCPTCGGVGYLAIAYTDDAEPCPNCNPSAGVFPVITPEERRRQFKAWAK